MIINIKQGDRRPVAEVTITRGGVPVSLAAAASVTFKMRYQGRKDLTINSSAVVTDAVEGLVEYRWGQGETDIPGKYEAEWEVLWLDSTTETFPTLGSDIVVVHGDLDGS
jgi:hypothetical protein